MPGNGKVFISHAHEDNERCQPLLRLLSAWGVDYWFDTQQLDPGDDLSVRIQHAIQERDILIRICTPAAQRSYWVRLELGAFRGLLSEEQKYQRDHRRSIINLILDPSYQLEPFDYGATVIDATRQPPSVWLPLLRHALGLRPLPASAYPSDQSWEQLAGTMAPAHPPRGGMPMRMMAVGLAALLLVLAFAGLALAGGGGLFGSRGGTTTPTTSASPSPSPSPTKSPTPDPTPTPPLWTFSSFGFRLWQSTGWTSHQDASGVTFTPPGASQYEYLRIALAESPYASFSAADLVNSVDAASHYLVTESDQTPPRAETDGKYTQSIGGVTWQRRDYSFNTQSGSQQFLAAFLAVQHKGRTYILIELSTAASTTNQVDGSAYEALLSGFKFLS